MLATNSELNEHREILVNLVDLHVEHHAGQEGTAEVIDALEAAIALVDEKLQSENL